MPLLYKGWIKLSTAEIAIQWISVNKTNHAIRCIVICQVDNVIRLLNNPAQVDNSNCASVSYKGMDGEVGLPGIPGGNGDAVSN